MWGAVGLSGALWVRVGFYGVLWVVQWVSLQLYGSMWGAVGLIAALWVRVGRSGSERGSACPRGALWVAQWVAVGRSGAAGAEEAPHSAAEAAAEGGVDPRVGAAVQAGQQHQDGERGACGHTHCCPVAAP